MDELMKAGQCETEMSPRRLTIPEKLKTEKVNLEQRLADVNAAIEALEQNPEIERVLHLVSKVTRY